MEANSTATNLKNVEAKGSGWYSFIERRSFHWLVNVSIFRRRPGQLGETTAWLEEDVKGLGGDTPIVVSRLSSLGRLSPMGLGTTIANVLGTKAVWLGDILNGHIHQVFKDRGNVTFIRDGHRIPQPLGTAPSPAHESAS